MTARLVGSSLLTASLLVTGCGDEGATATSVPTDISGGSGGSTGGAAGATGATGGHMTGGEGGSGGGLAGGGTGAGAPTGPTRYPADTLTSPISPHVARELTRIADNDPARASDVFMKVGASGTVSKNLLYCFAGDAQPQYQLDLDGRDELLPGIEIFRQGNAAGNTPFDRPTIAAKVGHSAGWVIDGTPSPLDEEIAAVNPRFAFVNYGTNDMGLGATYSSAMPGFYANMSQLLDELEAQGIIAIISGLNPRSDREAAALWVPTYDTVTRGLAEARQLPYISLYLAAKGLPDQGLISDGIHGNAYNSGGSQPCIFTAEGLEYGYNIRNLLSMQVLDQTRRVVLDAEPAPDATLSHMGDGKPGSPVLIDTLPFTHSADTTSVSQRNIDTYAGCSADQDESGPELLYRLDLSEATALRAIVLDREGVDIDIHLLQGDASGASCLERDDRIIERTLQPGTYYFALDTYVSSSNGELAGEYLFVIQPCEAGDDDCS